MTGEEPNAESAMGLFYKGMFKLDVTECTKIEPPLNELEIVLSGAAMPFPEFVKRNVETVALDHFSTKEEKEQKVKGMKGTFSYEILPEFIQKGFEDLYVEVFRQWAVIKYDKKAVGRADTLHFHNGFPNFINMDEYLKNPNDVYDKAMKEVLNASPRLVIVDPVRTARTDVYLHRDFLAQNPVRKR